MINKEEAVEAYKRLILHRMANIGHLSTALFLHQIGFEKKFHIHTIVYQGEGFIPHAVRKAAIEPIEEMQKYIQTWLIVDEDLYSISLHYTAEVTISSELFCEILYEFDDVAATWREIFEERDRQDLVYMPVQSR